MASSTMCISALLPRRTPHFGKTLAQGPLRSATELEGIKKGLTAQEKKQLREGNEHSSFSGDAMVTCIGSGTSFALENPEPLNEVSIFNMPKIKEVARQHEVKNVDLDQCVFGAETRKRTRLMYYQVDHKSLAGRRCNHPIKEWIRMENPTKPPTRG